MSTTVMQQYRIYRELQGYHELRMFHDDPVTIANINTVCDVLYVLEQNAHKEHIDNLDNLLGQLGTYAFETSFEVNFQAICDRHGIDLSEYTSIHRRKRIENI